MREIISGKIKEELKEEGFNCHPQWLPTHVKSKEEEALGRKFEENPRNCFKKTKLRGISCSAEVSEGYMIDKSVMGS